MHYLPFAFPFFLFLFLIFLLIVFLIELGLLGYAYHKMGIDSRYVFSILLLSLLGSYVNIPVYQMPPEVIRSGGIVYFYGVPYIVPFITKGPGTILAVNLGGAVIPTILAVYLLMKNRLYVRGLLGVAAAAIIVHFLAHAVPGVGIAVPVLVPVLAATVLALILSWRYAPAMAFIIGTLGTLIGADLTNLGKIRGLGAPVASIGGAGTYDGIFITGIVAVLLASVIPRRRSPKKIPQ